MPSEITESGTASRVGPGRVRLTILTPGVGSSGEYSRDVLEQAARDRSFPKGTQCHLNHDSAADRRERPEGDLRNLVGVLTEDAYVENGNLVAEARIGSQWRSFVDDFHDVIGVSIAASADIVNEGGTRVVKSILPSPFNRVDLVTVPGRGGRISEVIEAARNITDSRPHAAGNTEEKEGPTVATTTIEESRLAHLEEASRRVEAAEAQNTTLAKQVKDLTAERDAAVTEAASLREAAEQAEKAAREKRAAEAEAVIKEAYGENAPAFLVSAAKHAAEQGTFDAAAAREAAVTLTANEAGNPSGLGTPANESGALPTDADIANAL